jgi:hypothetical protein
MFWLNQLVIISSNDKNIIAMRSQTSQAPPPPHGATSPSRPETPPCLGVTITLRHTKLIWTPVDK